MPRFRFGLRYKIIFIVVTGVVTIEAVGNVLDYYSHKRLLLREIEHQHIVLTAELNQALVDFSITVRSSANNALSRSEPVHHLAQTLTESDKNLLSIVVYQENNGAFGNGILLGGGSLYPDSSIDIPLLRTALRTGHTEHYIDYVGSNVLLKTFVPVQLPTGVQYVDEFITDYGQAIQSVVQQQLQMSILVSTGILILAIISSYTLALYIANPLIRLQRHIETMNSIESAEPLELRRNDEIGDLADNVNEMSARLTMDFKRVIHDERSSTMKYLGIIAHALVHELRSPAVASRNLLRLLQDMQTFTPQVEETLRHITTSVEHVNSVIENFSRMVHEGSSLDMKNHDVADIVQQAIGICTPLSLRCGIFISTNRSPGLYMARVDEVGLRRVIVNLLKNGVDAMEGCARDGGIQVSMSLYSHQLRIDVTDQGNGIPRERWTEIFTPFKSTKQDGFGLGLALSAMLIIGMGGNIFVQQSSPRLGTTMRIVLPAVEVSGTRNRLFVDADRRGAR